MFYWCCWCLLMVLLFNEFSLLCSINVCQHLCIVLYWCSLAFSCCVLLVFIDVSLLCLLAPPCCVLLMFINISLLCSICVCQCFFLLCFVFSCVFLLSFIGVWQCFLAMLYYTHWHLHVVFCWCYLSFQTNIFCLHFFV
jgi:hypothetical protein